MTVPPKMDLTCVIRRHVKVLSRRKCNFSDAVFNPPQFVDIFPDPQLTSLFTIARSKEIGVQCQACDVSALNINTDCATTEAHGVFHKEGGWPRDVNRQEAAAYSSDPFWKNLFDHKENDSYIKC
ncbi:dynein axonemal intermediate chain 2-like [Daphnia pulex]|uniref:dynein axonemal intermediate chain 2-like n=1 Tax=Daphnia pulex TaxID=6669 RepID=UPI001EE0F44F|nr:dynein axonemal intermediate chain 2-like [Daphnia pulex]